MVRDPNKIYKMITGPDGTGIYVEMSAEELIQREADEARAIELELLREEEEQQKLRNELLMTIPSIFVSTGQTLQSGIYSALNFNVEVSDVVNIVDPSSSDKIIIPSGSAGQYVGNFVVTFLEETSITPNIGDRGLKIYINGEAKGTQISRAVTTGDTVILSSGELGLQGLDIAQIYVMQNSGNPMSVTASIRIRKGN